MKDLSGKYCDDTDSPELDFPAGWTLYAEKVRKQMGGFPPEISKRHTKWDSLKKAVGHCRMWPSQSRCSM